MVAETILDLVAAIQGLISSIQWVLGGFFGLYLVYYAVSYFTQRKTLRTVEQIRHELHELNSYLRRQKPQNLK
ncbi:hypothetical protein HY639_00070 [Candidatus Woesearchaeota archaeon]|nr:hypothetical protein [Candidatus Woesearchaeota archaeon]